VCHLHINPAYAQQDLNSVLPVARLDELAALGEIGASPPSHYSHMGYTLRPERFLRESVTGIVRHLREESAGLVPGSLLVQRDISGLEMLDCCRPGADWLAGNDSPIAAPDSSLLGNAGKRTDCVKWAMSEQNLQNHKIYKLRSHCMCG
jgi:hypothetical protein